MKYKISGYDQYGNSAIEEMETSDEFESIAKRIGSNPTKEQRMELLACGLRDKLNVPVTLIDVK